MVFITCNKNKLIVSAISLLLNLAGFAQLHDSLSDGNKIRKNYTVSGLIKDAASGESLPYANISIETGTKSSISNAYGFYSMTLPSGVCTLICKYVGYELLQMEIKLTEDLRIDIGLKAISQELQEVIVKSDKNDMKNVEQRLSKIDLNTVKQLPSLCGEADLLRSIKLLPGVNSTAEAGAGITVRGGSYDQNLMLLDEATVYNASHLIGLYSTFNPGIIKDITFYKSGIPACYGGRISSVMEVTQKEGNIKSFHVNGGIGLLSSNLTLEGPVVKDKSSFIIAARRSYVDLFFKYIPNEQVHDVKTYFYDVNSKVNFIINQNNRIYLSCYLGKDLTGLAYYKEEYGNITGTLRYNHIFSNKFFSNTSIIFSKYNMSDGGSGNEWGWENKVGLDHYEFKNALSYFTAKHRIEMGIKAIYYIFYPGDLKPVGDSSKTLTMNIPDEYALESALYLSDEYQVLPGLVVQYGAYFSYYTLLGPLDVFEYAPGEPMDPSTITDTVIYKRNELISDNHSIEPRISIKYNLSENHALKISYNRMAQYIQQISNTTLPLPYNMWKASDPYIKPLRGNQYALGYFSNLWSNKFELSCEIYYKTLENVIEVKPGTDISLNPTIDAGLLQGKGRAYGIEVMATKTQGRLTGMLSYAWSRTEKKIDSKFQEERINLGNYYPADYDIPNKLTITGQYSITYRFSLTTDFTYQTGRPVTLPAGQYVFFNSLMPYYPDKNMERLPDFHRLDIGVVLKNKQKADRNFESYWTFSVYNVYGRENTYSIYIRRKPESKDTEAIKLWIFSVVPSISYNFKF
jgi:hypothetical protein